MTDTAPDTTTDDTVEDTTVDPTEDTTGTDTDDTQDTGADDTDSEKRRLNAEAAARRRQAREAQTQLKTAKADLKAAQDELEKLRLANASDQERAIAEAAKTAAEQADERWRTKLVGVGARAALAAAGCPSQLLTDMARLLDTAGADIDDDGAVTGLDEQVERLKATYFPPVDPAKKQTGRPVVDTGNKKTGGRQLTATERQAAARFGNA